VYLQLSSGGPGRPAWGLWDEWYALLECSKVDHERRVQSDESDAVERCDGLLPNRPSVELAAAGRWANPWTINSIPLGYVDEMLALHPGWIVDRIAPRPTLYTTTGNDRFLPLEESVHRYSCMHAP